MVYSENLRKNTIINKIKFRKLTMFIFISTFCVNHGLSLSFPPLHHFPQTNHHFSWIIWLDFIDKLICAHKVFQLILKTSQFWGCDATVVKRTSYQIWIQLIPYLTDQLKNHRVSRWPHIACCCMGFRCIDQQTVPP